MPRSPVPPVVHRAILLCYGFAVLNLILAACMTQLPVWGMNAWPDLGLQTWQTLSRTFLVLAVFVAIVNVVLALLRPSPTSYALHITNLTLNCGAIIWAPFCLPVLRGFRTAEIEKYYGIGTVEGPKFLP